MSRLVTVYECGWPGYGCFERKIEVTDENFVSEDEHTITIKETYMDNDCCEREGDSTYVKDIDTFIKSENDWYDKHIAEIKERHELTLKNAEGLRTTSEA